MSKRLKRRYALKRVYDFLEDKLMMFTALNICFTVLCMALTKI